MAASDAKPVPYKNTAFRVTFPIINKDGDLVAGAASLDSEVSIDGGTFADCTNEATQIATSSGVYFLDLTAAEMNGDTIAIIVKTSTPNAKTTPIVIYPEETGDIRVQVTQNAANVITATSIASDAITAAKVADGTIDANTFATGAITATALASDTITAAKIAADAITAAKIADGAIDANTFAAGAITAAAIADGAIDRATFAADTGLQTVRSNTAQAGASTSITLDASASSTTDFYKHCLIYLTGGTGVGQYRLCTAYNGTTKVATITPAWATNPDGTSTFAVLPAGLVNVEAFGGGAGTFSAGRAEVNTTHFGGSALTQSSGRPEVNTTHAAGTAWGSGAITAGSIATDAITASKIADGAIDANTFATGAITATAIAADAITAAKVADGTIDANTFASGAITASAIASDAITAAKIADGAIDANTFAAGAINSSAVASNALDNISTTAPSGVASNFREMVVQTWRWFFKKTTLSASELKTYADNGSTVVTTQPVSDVAGTQTRDIAT